MKIGFKNDLLIPMPECAGKDLRQLGVLRGSSRDGSTSDIVTVWAVNATNREGIIAVCRNLLDAIKRECEEKPSEAAEKQLKSFGEFVGRIGCSGYEHPAPEELIKAVSEHCRKKLTADEVVYVGGVTYLEA